MYGPKKDLKYQIKLNDVVLDRKEQRSKSSDGEPSNFRGRLMRGTNFNEEPAILPEHLKERNDDLFGIKKMN